MASGSFEFGVRKVLTDAPDQGTFDIGPDAVDESAIPTARTECLSRRRAMTRAIVRRAAGAADLVIPDFTDVGQPDLLLPKGQWDATMADIEAQLVVAFPNSTTRRDIFDRWQVFRSAVSGLVVVHPRLSPSHICR